MQDFVKINETDNVAVALRPVAKGETLQIGDAQVTVLEEIPQGHKIALLPIKEGEDIVKYGFCIGHAKKEIQKGQWVHVHNLQTALGDLLSYTYEPVDSDTADQTEKRVCAMNSGLFPLLAASIPLQRLWRKKPRSL